MSILYPKPSWQVAPGVPDDGARDVPDVALTASPLHDPYIVISGGTTYAAGGTSLAAPAFAGMLALSELTQFGMSGLSHGLGNINPLLYTLANQSYADQVFHDITSGGNFVPCVAGTPNCVNGSFGYAAGPGYDLVTGLGSVNAFDLGAAIESGSAVTLSTSSTQVGVGAPVTLTVQVLKYNGAAPTSGVVLNDATAGDIATVGTANLDASGSATLSLVLSLGTHSITATYVDLTTSFSRSVSQPVVIVVSPAPPPAPLLTYPTNGATDIPLGVQLKWSNPGFPASNPSYDLYFGTNPSPQYWGRPSEGFWPGALAPNTVYYWKVVATNELGGISSPVWSFATTGTAYTITTIAGREGVEGLSRNGTLAMNALLNGTTDVAVDAAGNLFVAENGGDPGRGLVQMINTAGILSTVAGGGTGGDGGPATSAQLTTPNGIAIDGQGNLYISDAYPQLSNRIRKVSNGIITTIAGSLTAGYSGDGGPAVNAQLNHPLGLAVDSQGDLYVADASNHCIREIIAGIISTVAGRCGSAGSDGDGGPATSASLNTPNGVAVDATGNLYIADTGNCQIRKVVNGIISTVINVAAPGSNCTYTGPPQRLVVDNSGSIFFTELAFADQFANGVLTPIAGGGQALPGNGGPGTSAALNQVDGLAMNSAGVVFLVENSALRALTPGYVPPAPSINSNGVWNAATSVPGPVAPGSIAAVSGAFGFGSPALPSGVPLPTALAGISIQVQSGSFINVPLFYASDGQVNIQIPWELTGESSATIRPVLNSVAGPTQTLRLAAFAPGIFTITESSGTPLTLGYTGIATAGGSIQILCTGLGPVTNQPPTGSAASGTSLSPTTNTPTVTIGGVLATVLSSALAPATVGEYLVTVQVPAGITPGPSVPLVLSIGGVASNKVNIAVK